MDNTQDLKTDRPTTARANRRKLLAGLVIAAVLFMIIVTTTQAAKSRDGQNRSSVHSETPAQTKPIESSDDLVSLTDIEFHVRTSTLEYSQKDIDPVSLVKYPEVEGLEVFTEDAINLEKLGKQKVVYTASLNGQQGKFEEIYNIRDTKSPSIELVEENVTMAAGDEYNPTTNITSVSDNVEGRLEQVETPPASLKDDELGRTYKNGWYTIAGDYDANAPGKYFITVEAYDNHGNKTSKEFSIDVEAAPTPKPEPETAPAPTGEVEPSSGTTEEAVPQQPKQTYIINTNTGVYHHPGCRAIRQMNEENKQEYEGTSQEVQDMGYRSCGICHP